MKTHLYITLFAGLALATVLIAWQGFGIVVGALAGAGWGLLIIVPFHLLPMLMSSIAWRYLLPPKNRIAIGKLLFARWLGESVNSLLPVAQIGGELVKARWIMSHGIQGPIAGASVIVDLTVAVFTQIIFTVIGLCLLVLYLGVNHIVVPVLIGIIIISLLLVGFYIAQRKGIFTIFAALFEKLAAGREWLGIAGGAARLDATVHKTYRRRKSLAAASTWRLLGWLFGTGEIWLIMLFLGHPLSLYEALLLESLAQAVRAAAFFIPAALGVQEGGFLLLGAALGIPPHIALALSLAKRMRELLLGIPGLFVWQYKSVWQKKTHAGVRNALSTNNDSRP